MQKVLAGMGFSTDLPCFDFETYSSAGFIWNPKLDKFIGPLNSDKKGLPVIGAAVYSEHPSTEVLSMAYDLKDGCEPHLWIPGMALPTRLFDYIHKGGILEAWNCSFERWIWVNVCIPKYGFPELPFNQLHDAKAKAKAYGYPGGLDDVGKLLNIKNKKLADGKRLLNKFSMPHAPTKKDKRYRILPEHDFEDATKLYQYNIMDVKAESEISKQVPDLSGFELEFWLCDQAINYRGVQLDFPSILNAIAIIEAASEKYNLELSILTQGEVSAASEIQKLRKWLVKQGTSVPSLDADMVIRLRSNPLLLPHVRRALEIRELLNSAAIKKLYSMHNQIARSGRVHDLFGYYAARTGRAAGYGAQPQNLPRGGPIVHLCNSCKRYFGSHAVDCRWCGESDYQVAKWNTTAMEQAFSTVQSAELLCIEYYWGDATALISGCLRGMFIAKDGYDLICSDYSAIEAVVLAALSGEDWRLQVFRTHGKIYEQSAATITGIPFPEIIKHKEKNGEHHPARNLGKVSELASGYGGWLGAWKQFGADEFLNDDQMKEAILAWRDASPLIVEMWGGQKRHWQTEYYGLEGSAIQAIAFPGKIFKYRSISYFVKDGTLFCQLPSGRYLNYHRVELKPSMRRMGTQEITFEGWNTNPKNGGIGWIRMSTYGGKLTENVVQAVARDILAHAIINLEKAGYPVVLHVHDEIVSEIPENFGSIAEFEKIMSTLPEWAQDWPLKAAGGWRAKRYSK